MDFADGTDGEKRMSRLNQYPFGWSTATMTRIAAVVVGLMGLGMLVAGISERRQAGVQRDWPAVPAIIESSRVRSAIGKEHQRNYFADVGYVYQVGGATRRGQTVFALGHTEGLQDKAREFEGRYSKGSSLAVFYDPAHPDQSVLKRATDAEFWKTLGAGIVTLAFGVVLWRHAPRQKD